LSIYRKKKLLNCQKKIINTANCKIMEMLNDEYYFNERVRSPNFHLSGFMRCARRQAAIGGASPYFCLISALFFCCISPENT
jgi:hypothetical protein